MAKVEKGVLSQGTQVWIKHGDTPELTKMICITGITLGDDSVNDIDDTCLEEEDTTTSIPGLTTPGEGSISINTDPKNDTHMKLLQLADERATIEVFIGWSDSKEPPVLETGSVTLPPTRTWTSFVTQLKDTNPTFEPNSLVKHSVPMKRQSKAITAYKTNP
ncbi:phage tail tube protein [Psychrobacter sp. CAM01]|uniref:phage tail tube protein n=1 Tax=Psychrobacter sp. CAM01 TaxID=3080335 RepID=UPI002936039F|nr:phage tail tube protein [Psychrobacter sp. CAM01]MDV2860343.1 phage tail tube protein [Psychrobacter sp. CAM01]